MSVTPAMRPNWRSSGIATAEAIVSGLAPGSAADTWMVGNSTCGMGDTGRRRNARPPARASARVRREVATGRLMKRAEMLTPPPPAPLHRSARPAAVARAAGPAGRGEVHDRGGVEGAELAHDEPAADGEDERAAQPSPRPGDER